MNEIFNNYGNEFKRCFSFKGHITNKDFVLYLLMNAILMSAIASFVIGVYDGYTNETSSMKMILFSILFMSTSAGVVVKKINTYIRNKAR